MILLSSNTVGDGFDIHCSIHSTDAGGELASILKAIEKEYPNVLAQALDYLMDESVEVTK